MSDAAKLGKRGPVVIPADGILIRAALALPVEVYSPERKAEFLLNNAVGAKDYARARAVVKKEMGIDPSSIPHVRLRA